MQRGLGWLLVVVAGCGGMTEAPMAAGNGDGASGGAGGSDASASRDASGTGGAGGDGQGGISLEDAETQCEREERAFEECLAMGGEFFIEYSIDGDTKRLGACPVHCTAAPGDKLLGDLVVNDFEGGACEVCLPDTVARACGPDGSSVQIGDGPLHIEVCDATGACERYLLEEGIAMPWILGPPCRALESSGRTEGYLSSAEDPPAVEVSIEYRVCNVLGAYTDSESPPETCSVSLR